MSVASRIKGKLTQALAPSRLEIVDESHLHQGHAGWRPSGESHFYVEIASAAFEGVSQVARHRMVYDLLAEELREQIHALRLKTTTR